MREFAERRVSRRTNTAFRLPPPALRVFLLPLAACLLPLCLESCAVPVTPTRVVYEDPTTFVRLEPDPHVFPELPDTFHSHPASIPEENLAEILRGMKVRDHRIGIHSMIAGEAPWEPVFEEEQITLLAPQLAEALARADVGERVTYYLSRPQTSIKREITTGGLYVQGNHLHFVLANRDTLYGVPAHGMVYDQRYPMRPDSPKWFDLHFEPEGAVVEQEFSVVDFLLGQEKDELVIDLEKLGLGLPVV